MTAQTERHHRNQAKCRSCGATIIWLRTATATSPVSKWMPVDPEGVERQAVLFEPEKHRSHFASCPNAQQHRKRS